MVAGDGSVFEHESICVFGSACDLSCRVSIGSVLYARFCGRVRDAWGVFALLVSAAGVVALLEIAGLSLWQRWSGMQAVCAR